MRPNKNDPDNDRLKSCPFCEGKARLMMNPARMGFYLQGGTYYVHCTVCGACSKPSKNKKTAIANWNRRPDDNG